VSVALFWVGGWGLARDVDLEENLHRARERAAALEKEAEHAQLLALKSHLDPHFLFNTLNAIAEWCREDGETAERAILELSSMLRTVMAGIKETEWPLAKEIALSESLFDLHRIRDPQRFTYEKRYDAIPDLMVPPMLLLPLSENAMKHGPAAGHKGNVTLAVRTQNGAVVIEIENPGAYAGPRAGGSGLSIVEKRMRLAFGTRAKVDLRATDDGKRTRARITLPG
jgi:LytS/YehU family sensor histidine kinase